MALHNSRKSNRRKSRSNRHHRRTRALRLEGLDHRQMLAAVAGLDFALDAEEQPVRAQQVDLASYLDVISQESFSYTEEAVEDLASAIDTCLDGQGTELQSESYHRSGTYETGVLGIDLDWNIDATVDFSDLEIDSVELTMVPGSGRIPYYLELAVSLDDITFEADVDAGIHTQAGDGVTIDSEASGTLEDVQFTLTLTPPREGINEFSLDSAVADATLDASYATDVDISLTAQTKAGLVGALSLIGLPPLAGWALVEGVTAGLENQLESALTGEIDQELHLDVEDRLTDFADTAEQIEAAIGLIEFSFWTSAGTQTDCVDLPYDLEAVEIHSVEYTEGTGAVYWVAPASEDTGLGTAVVAGPEMLPRYTVGIREVDPRDLLAVQQPTDTFHRPSPCDGTTEQPKQVRFGSSSSPAETLGYDVEGQATNSDAWDTANDPRRVVDALAEHSWKVEEVSPDVIESLAEDRLKLLSGVNGMLFDVNR